MGCKKSHSSDLNTSPAHLRPGCAVDAGLLLMNKVLERAKRWDNTVNLSWIAFEVVGSRHRTRKTWLFHH